MKNQLTNLQIIELKGKIAVFIDAANVFYASKTLKFRIDFKKLIRFFQTNRAACRVSYYTGYDPDNKKQLKFLARLEEFGYRVVRKPVKKIRSKGKIVEKANVDVELAIDALEESSSYKSLILISGDSDFAYLVSKLKSKGKNVIAVSARGHISKELIKLSDHYLPLEKLEKEIGFKKSPRRKRRGKLSWSETSKKY